MSRAWQKSPVLAAFVALWTLPAALAAQTGVIVEQVEKGSEAEGAGLRAGDTIVAWSQGTADGQLDSPFDWADFEVEWLPRGIVTLRGSRDSRALTWTLPNGSPGIAVRPVLRPDLEPLWQRCRDSEKADRFAAAAEGWRGMLGQLGSSDPPWLAAWLQYRLGQSLARARQFAEGDAAFQKAMDQAQPAEPRGAWQLLMAWGKTFYDRNDLARALDCFQRSLTEASKSMSPSLMEAVSLDSMGRVTYERGDLDHAEGYHQRALAIRQKLAPGSLDEAASLNNLGNVAKDRSELERAEEFFEKALAIRQKLAPGGLDVAASLGDLAVVARIRGDLDRAEEYNRQALAIRQKLAPGSLLAVSLNNSAIVAWNRGDLGRAEEYLKQALAIKVKQAPGSLSVATTLNNLGVLANDRGDPDQAEEYYRQALAIRQKLAPDSLSVASTLHNLGAVVAGRGDPRRAEPFFLQALAIWRKLAPNGLKEALTLNNLGEAALELGDAGRAEDYGRQALAIRQKLAPGGLDESESLNSLGEVALANGDLSHAEEYLQRALEIRHNFAPGSREEATTLHTLGIALRRKGETEAAGAYLARAADALDSQTARLGGTADERATFRAKYAPYYGDLEDALLAQHQPERAYHVSERARARSLLQLLAERDLVFAADVPADMQRARKRNAGEYDRTQAQIAGLNPAKDKEKIGKLQARLRELNAQREQIAEQIKKTSPRFAALQYPQPLDLAATRAALDPGTALLSYAIGKESSMLFVVQPANRDPGLSVFPLALNEPKLQKDVQDFRSLIEAHRADADGDLLAQSRRLYDLLVRPAEAVVAGSARILIIPDGPLQVLPFAALRRNTREYLVDWKPLHTVVSATVYAELRKMRHPAGAHAVELAAFGDPLLPSAGQEDLKRSGDTEVRGASERGYVFAPLPFSRQEVEGIAALYPNRVRIYLGADATEEHAKALGKDVRYIHFATHGVFDPRFPLNSALVLTIPERVTEGQDNGLLQAWEIFEQMRLDADLVTLSACKTALGQELRGEGLIGLTRAFQYAGARSILASLWDVEDFRTMQLMKRFYAELKQGRSKDAALRAAQLELAHSQSSSAPYYWADFSLIGDWR